MSNIKYHTVGTVPKSNKKIVETEIKQIHDRSPSWLGTCKNFKGSFP